ncbi:MAG TPA: hypothetical protein VF808_03405 [Ktedonobacterales bacterium]
MIETSRRGRGAGVVLIGAGLLWAIAILIEYRYGLKPPNHGALYALDQDMFFVAELGYVTGILGLMWVGAAGAGWFGRVALGLFALGWIILVIAAPLAWITRDNNLLLFPIGGLTAMLGGLLAGVAVIVARQWTGWRRYTVMFYALYYLCALLLPLFLARHGPTLITESLWGLAWTPIGAALASQARAQPALIPATAQWSE